MVGPVAVALVSRPISALAAQAQEGEAATATHLPQEEPHHPVDHPADKLAMSCGLDTLT